MIRKTFLTLAVVFFAVLTLVIMPVNAGEVFPRERNNNLTNIPKQLKDLINPTRFNMLK